MCAEGWWNHKQRATPKVVGRNSNRDLLYPSKAPHKLICNRNRT